jgi:hypothetical protein
MTKPEAFASGAGCAHFDGRGHAADGAAWTDAELAKMKGRIAASHRQYLGAANARAWASGYLHGYKLGRDGLPLDMELAGPPDSRFDEDPHA